ncbi:MAG: hypothetical protein M3340_01090 [Actinomycetota bacterium]|nr:hypothetical protein [Actinomycetota bacterium]
MTLGDLAVLAVVAGVGLALGVAVRRWWLVAIAAGPSVAWLALTVPGWTEEDIHGNTGADFFLLGFGYVGAPMIVGAALGVWLGRRRRA